VTVALHPFNKWYTDRDFPALFASRGLDPDSIPTERPALSFTTATR
jgi:hypothetical protein